MPQPFVPGTNVLEVVCQYIFGMDISENVYHVLGASAWTPDSAKSMCDLFVLWETTYAKTMRSHQIGLNQVTGRDLTTQNGITVESIVAPPIAGAVNTDMLPSNVTLAVSAKTGLAGRSFRGRTYHIGMPTGFVQNDAVVTSELSPIVGVYNQLVANVAGAGAQLCVFSRRHNNAWRTAGVATPIAMYRSDGLLDSQRRRLPGK